MNIIDHSPLFFDKRISNEWFTTEEAAEYLGVSANAVRIMVHRGKLKSHRLGRRLRFHLFDLRSAFVPYGG
jgi:excisionase family DNA binding protein